MVIIAIIIIIIIVILIVINSYIITKDNDNDNDDEDNAQNKDNKKYIKKQSSSEWLFLTKTISLTTNKTLITDKTLTGEGEKMYKNVSKMYQKCTEIVEWKSSIFKRNMEEVRRKNQTYFFYVF